MQPVFLTAEWRKLVMANFLIDPAILKKYIPYKTELDDWNGNHFASVVGFMFLNTKVLGLLLPYHKNFDEVNLRFYVRYKEDGIWKRGVTFIKEIVPKRIVTAVANKFYNENYITLPMKREFIQNENDFEIKYNFGEKNFLYANAGNEKIALKKNSEEEFITEHFWGYTKCSDEKTSEYQVEHPRWDLYNIKKFEMNLDTNDIKNIYGEEFVEALSAKPHSVLLAEGSEITVRKGKFIQ
jgi:uncharacterized protein YqjF (DUF2071 family)